MDASYDRASWRPPSSVTELRNFRQQDKEAARDFLTRVKSLFPLIEVPEFWDDDNGIALFKDLSWFISATIVLADWVGSSTRYFPRIAKSMEVDEYWQQHALVKAKVAVTVFPPSSDVASFSGITALFPFIQQPTPLQKKTLELDIDKQGPQLFILEDVTGAGKTEAALILTHRLMATGKAPGALFWSADDGDGECHVRSYVGELAGVVSTRFTAKPGAGA